jgi:hypothetical protein
LVDFFFLLFEVAETAARTHERFERERVYFFGALAEINGIGQSKHEMLRRTHFTTGAQ